VRCPVDLTSLTLISALKKKPFIIIPKRKNKTKNKKQKTKKTKRKKATTKSRKE